MIQVLINIDTMIQVSNNMPTNQHKYQSTQQP